MILAPMPIELSYRPNVLYLASIERIITSRRLIDQTPQDFVVARYLAGLSVESILQAIALCHGAAADARHDLRQWLNRCPLQMIDALRGVPEWSHIITAWDNGIRYLSFDGFLGHLRRRNLAQGRKGGVESMVRTSVKAIVESARIVHEKGTIQWQSFTRR